MREYLQSDLVHGSETRETEFCFVGKRGTEQRNRRAVMWVFPQGYPNLIRTTMCGTTKY